jgi:hypothetical protein
MSYKRVEPEGTETYSTITTEPSKRKAPLPVGLMVVYVLIAAGFAGFGIVYIIPAVQEPKQLFLSSFVKSDSTTLDLISETTHTSIRIWTASGVIYMVVGAFMGLLCLFFILGGRGYGNFTQFRNPLSGHGLGELVILPLTMLHLVSTYQLAFLQNAQSLHVFTWWNVAVLVVGFLYYICLKLASARNVVSWTSIQLILTAAVINVMLWWQIWDNYNNLHTNTQRNLHYPGSPKRAYVFFIFYTLFGAMTWVRLDQDAEAR